MNLMIIWRKNTAVGALRTSQPLWRREITVHAVEPRKENVSRVRTCKLSKARSYCQAAALFTSQKQTSKKKKKIEHCPETSPCNWSRIQFLHFAEAIDGQSSGPGSGAQRSQTRRPRRLSRPS